jgi:acetylornithine deacetylase
VNTIDRAISTLADLIGFPTVSAESNLDMIRYVAAYLEGAGADVEIHVDTTETKANLFATLGPAGDGGIVLSGHTDVVPVEDQQWSSDPFVLQERDGRLYGRGACDMKGFIACVLATVPSFAQATLARPVHFAFTYDEEVGCLGARALVNEVLRAQMRPSLAIVGEPTLMRIVEGHKGCYEYTVAFHGLEGHSAMPDAGVNAVEYAVRYVVKLMQLGDELRTQAPSDSRFQPPWTTLQVGRFSGGVARNVIAASCAVDWEMRPVRRVDAAFVKAGIGSYVDEVLRPAMQATAPSANIVTTVVGEVDGLEPVPNNEALRLVAELTGNADADVVPFGTEAGLYQELGMSAVVCGPGSIEQAHKPDEFVTRDQLELALAMLARLVAKLEAY